MMSKPHYHEQCLYCYTHSRLHMLVYKIATTGQGLKMAVRDALLILRCPHIRVSYWKSHCTSKSSIHNFFHSISHCSLSPVPALVVTDTSMGGSWLVDTHRNVIILANMLRTCTLTYMESALVSIHKWFMTTSG